MPRPRILVNALSLAQGGGRSFVTNLLRELARDDRGLHFTLLAQAGALEGMDTSGAEVECLHLPRLPLRVLWRVAYEELLLPLRARRTDLLFCVADLSPAVSFTPTVALLRSLNIYDHRWYDDARTRSLERLVRLGLPRVRRVVFPSAAAAKLISSRIPVPPERVRIVPYGIAMESFQSDDHDADCAVTDNSSNRAPYLFLAAATEKHKNLRALIECLRYVQDTNLEVWVAGASQTDPGHRAELERYASQIGVGDRVRFLGAVPYHDILRYYRGALAFVFPSFIETFGHPLLEAMLVGTPVVASDIPAFREVAGDAALYFPPTDARALARAVDRVPCDPEATRRRIALGRARAAEFTWKRSVDGFCAVFKEVLEEG